MFNSKSRSPQGRIGNPIFTCLSPNEEGGWSGGGAAPSMPVASGYTALTRALTPPRSEREPCALKQERNCPLLIP